MLTGSHSNEFCRRCDDPGVCRSVGCAWHHVYPRGDLREHVTDCLEDCWCRPCVDEVNFLIVHNSADRREDYERVQ